MDVDDEMSVGLGLGLMTGTTPLGGGGGGASSSKKRPKIQRSELSEIIEDISKRQQQGMEGEGVGVVDADGEGESPGLDALATAASELA